MSGLQAGEQATLDLLIFDRGDGSLDSEVLLDNFHFTSDSGVPAPGALALLGLGLAGLASRCRKAV